MKRKIKFLITIITTILILLVAPNISFAKENIHINKSNSESKIIQEQEKTNTNIIETQKENLGISSFITEADSYTKDVFEDLNLHDLFNTAVKGKIEYKSVILEIINFFERDIVECLQTVTIILVIIIIHSILRSILEGLGNKGVGEIAYYVQYILIVTVIMSNFANIISIIKNSIQSLVDFVNLLLPILVSLMIVTGNVVFANMVQPLLLFLITFIGNVIISIIIPFLIVSTVLGIVSKISDRVQLDKLSKLFKSSIIWVLIITLTIFASIVSLESTLSNKVDEVTSKTAKAAVSNLIPVVGKILGDTIDTVIGCGGILKNAVGIVGIIVVLGICIKPIIRLLIFMLLYYLLSALVQPIADIKIINLLDQIGDTFKVLLAILCSVSTMVIIGVTIVIKASGIG